jgi:hypothetical protein
METYGSDDHSPTQFFLAHIIFDEEHGPVLKSYLAHELEIPRIILQGVTTTLFTMAIGVGEPTGEPDTAIIPINVTGIQGRVLINSFTVDDPEARGRNRIESFMLFIPRAQQDKLLQHSLAFSNILQEAISDIKIQNNGRNETYALEKVFGNIRKVLLTRIDNNIQNLISEICTDQETIVISDGTTIRAVHNIVLSPDFISLVNELPSLLRVYVDELKAFGTFFDALPIEIHGKTGNQQFYLIAIENNFILAFSSGKGRLGSLFRFFREILWDLKMQGISYSDDHISKYRTIIKDKRKSFPQNQYLDTSFELLKSFKPIITDASIIRCSCKLKKAEILRTSSSQTSFVCVYFGHH